MPATTPATAAATNTVAHTATTDELLAQIKGDLKSMTEIGSDLVAARVHQLMSPLKRATLLVMTGAILGVFGLADTVRWAVAAVLTRGAAGPDLMRDQLGYSALVLLLLAALFFALARFAVRRRTRRVAREVANDLTGAERAMARMMHQPA